MKYLNDVMGRSVSQPGYIQGRAQIVPSDSPVRLVSFFVGIGTLKGWKVGGDWKRLEN
jgi:hypothetical protein